MAVTVYNPPDIPAQRSQPLVFLAGSIDNGAAPEWQEYIIEFLTNLRTNVTVLNPRHKNWNKALRMSLDEPEFKNQVEWEQNGLRHADIIAMALLPGTLAPVSLMEFGQYADSGKIILYCPEGFWRKGNVDYICRNNWKIWTVGTLEDLALAIDRKAYTWKQ